MKKTMTNLCLTIACSLFIYPALGNEYTLTALPITKFIPRPCVHQSALPTKALLYRSHQNTEINPTAINHPYGIISFDFNKDTKKDYLFMEYIFVKGNEYRRDGYELRFVQCLSKGRTWTRINTDLRYTPSDSPRSEYITSRYDFSIEHRGNFLEILVSTFEHDLGSCYAKAPYRFNQSTQLFEVDENQIEGSCTPAMPDMPIFPPQLPTMTSVVF